MDKLENKKRNINKKEFITKIIEKQKLSFEQGEIGVNGILDFLNFSLKQDCTIEIRGFGKFKSKDKKVSFISFNKDF